MQAVQGISAPISSIQQLPAHPSKTVVKRAYNIYLTVKKCSYVWNACRLANPGHLASATVQAFAVPIAEKTGSPIATKCAVIAAETLNLAFNPVSWTVGKACHWLGDRAAEMIQDGLKIQNPELQDLVEVLANECANYSTFYTTKGIATGISTNQIPINLSAHQVRRLRIGRETPETGLFKGHTSVQARVVNAPVFSRTRIPAVDHHKIATIAESIKDAPKLSLCDNIVRIGARLGMASALVGGTALLLLTVPTALGASAPVAALGAGVSCLLMGALSLGCFSLIVALDFLEDFVLKQKETAKNIHALQQLQNKDELHALKARMGVWDKNLDRLLPSALYS